MKLKDIMTKNPTIITPDITLAEAARKMRDGDTGFLPVGENDRLIGTVTDRDIVIRGLAEGRDGNAPIRDILTDDLIYCFEDDDVEAAARKMKEQQIRRMVVLNREKRAVGVVSLGDIATRTANENVTADVTKKVSEKAA